MTREKEIEAKAEEVLPFYGRRQASCGCEACVSILRCRQFLKQAILSGRLWLPVSEKDITNIIRKRQSKFLVDDMLTEYQMSEIASALHKLLRGEMK